LSGGIIYAKLVIMEEKIEKNEMEVTFLENNQNTQGAFTESGTNIADVKRNNENSGLTYNEVKEVLAQKTGNPDAGSYSQTDIKNVQKNN
jgi:hypothetical protein